jgi:hypothetical protein
MAGITTQPAWKSPGAIQASPGFSTLPVLFTDLKRALLIESLGKQSDK